MSAVLWQLNSKGGYQMEANCRQEIIQLHQFLESWLTGRLNRNEQEFLRLTQALADDFVMIHPSGQQQDKAAVTADLWQAHGVRPEPFTIEIRNYTCRVGSETLCLVTYEEWQHIPNPLARVSTAPALSPE